MNGVHNRMRDARRATGWTQTDFGVWLPKIRSHAAVSDIERGKTRITVELLHHWSGLCGVPLYQIIGPGYVAYE